MAIIQRSVQRGQQGACPGSHAHQGQDAGDQPPAEAARQLADIPRLPEHKVGNRLSQSKQDLHGPATQNQYEQNGCVVAWA
jgi:hypothetical protein